MFSIYTKTEPILIGHWGMSLLGKRPYSSIQDAPGNKMKLSSKCKRQALINIVIWKYVNQVLFLHKEKKARFFAIKTGQVVLVNPALELFSAFMRKLVLKLVMSFVHWHSNFKRRAIVLWVLEYTVHKLITWTLYSIIWTAW